MTETTREGMLDLWSDLHKDAYGFRPRDWDRVKALSDEAMGLEFDRMCKTLEENEAYERIQQEAAKAKFELTLAELVSAGAGTRETAIRWLQDAHGAEHDIGYLEYQLGLPYHYLEGRS